MPLPDIDSITSYNGAPNGTLIDYSAVEDPNTDQPAAGANAQQASTAMMTRMASRAYCTFTYASGSSAPVNEHDAVWGTGAPVLPVVARSSAGIFTITWPTTVSDALGATRSVNFRRGWPNIEAAGVVLVGYVKRNSANVLQINIVNGSGTPTDPTGFAVTVFGI